MTKETSEITLKKVFERLCYDTSSILNKINELKYSKKYIKKNINPYVTDLDKKYEFQE